MSFSSRSLAAATLIMASDLSSVALGQPGQQEQQRRILHPLTITDTSRAALARLALAHGLPTAAITFIQRSNCDWTLIPEWNDRQGLVNEKKEYGAVVSVFGCNGVDYEDWRRFTNFTLFAPVLVEGTPTMLASTLPYQNLKINLSPTGTGYYCLYLRATGPSNWEAYMDGGSTATTGCKWDRPDITAPNIAVAAVENIEKGHRALPPTARLMQGRDGQLVFIGVPCGTYFCMAGTDEDDADEDHNATRAHPWYDYQVLAHIKGSKLKSSNVTAYVTADENLDLIKLDDFKRGYRRVATITVNWSGRKIPQKYKKAGFAKGDNELWVKLIDDGSGEALIINPDNPAGTKHRVMRTPFTGGYDAPSVARWGWQDKDEDIWVRCDYGCCMVSMT
jgi:hypothetical protein